MNFQREMNINQNPGEGAQAKMGCCLCLTAAGGVCSILVISLINLVVAGIYAFNNPDSAECWVLNGLERPALSREEITQVAEEHDIAVTDEIIKEYHQLFTMWFYWGFWLMLVPSIAGIITNVATFVDLI